MLQLKVQMIDDFLVLKKTLKHLHFCQQCIPVGARRFSSHVRMGHAGPVGADTNVWHLFKGRVRRRTWKECYQPETLFFMSPYLIFGGLLLCLHKFPLFLQVRFGSAENNFISVGFRDLLRLLWWPQQRAPLVFHLCIPL